MAEAYWTSEEQAADKALLLTFLDALDGAQAAMRLDECRLWTIRGRHGYVSTWGDSECFLLFVRCRSPMHWTYTKRRLDFCLVTQDGDDEGCLRLDRSPTAAEAREIRKALGIHQRKPPPARGFKTAPSKLGPVAGGREKIDRPAPDTGKGGESALGIPLSGQGVDFVDAPSQA